MYYTGPSEDFSRPGRTWYPSTGQERFPMWAEVTTAYHEGVPGHHLQVAQVVLQREHLCRVQRMGFISGHGEGWALYAERLMDELGYLDRPEYRLGMLAAQALRAVRVIIDIGMHLELEIPEVQPPTEAPFHPGRAVDRRSRPGLPLPPVAPPRGVHGQRDRPLPGLAGPGHQLQGRRAGLARGPGRRAAPPRWRLRPEGVPRLRARPRPAWASTSSAPSSPASDHGPARVRRAARAAIQAATRAWRSRNGRRAWRGRATRPGAR